MTSFRFFEIFAVLLYLLVELHGWRKIFPQNCVRAKCKAMKLSQTQQSNQKLEVKPDIINAKRFHHIEFYTGDASLAYSKFLVSLGMELASKTDVATGNSHHASYLLQSGDIRMLFTAPYINNFQREDSLSSTRSDSYITHAEHRLPSFDTEQCKQFFTQHGLAVKSVAIEVEDVLQAYKTMVDQGAVPRLAPTVMVDEQDRGSAHIAELHLYGNVTLRLLNLSKFKGTFLPNFVDIRKKGERLGRFGIERFDHIVGNVYNMAETADYIKDITGFHEFAEFVAEDVGTQETGLNSVVLANTDEYVLLPVNEPTYGSKKKSQILTYLEQNQGAGVQHLALNTNDIFSTLAEMKKMSELGCGFHLMPPPLPTYYQQLPERLGPELMAILGPEKLSLAQEYGILIDVQKVGPKPGLLLQIFTRPLGDRPTIFIEIIQRIGCLNDKGIQSPGCGGFGKGNFRALFKSIEDYETSLGINKVD